MTKVLMVCLGNICRSPLAEGILTSKVNPAHVFVDSAGTAGYHVGHPPDPRSIAVAGKHGLDISNQRCRKFNKSDFDEFDLIYVMDKANYSDILTMTSNQSQKDKVSLLLDVTNMGQSEVPDPYYGGDEGFENVYQMINDACEVIAASLNND
ncbi:MAG: low molecular weight phosphotyrosine protein phosphatase [Allomuricauda sp.]|nr:MAG: low molecular weight phosphotyrosine protein phosphatase [Allomuricauda sp.]